MSCDIPEDERPKGCQPQDCCGDPNAHLKDEGQSK